MQTTNLKRLDINQSQLPVMHPNLLTIARNDVQGVPKCTDSNHSFTESLRSINSGHRDETPVTAHPVDSYHSPPTPPHTPKHSATAIYQQRYQSLETRDSMRFSPLTVETNLMTSREELPYTPVTSYVHSDPCSLTSPQLTQVSFRDDMEGMRRKNEVWTRMLQEAIKTGHLDHDTHYQPVKPFPLQDPPKSKLRFKRQISIDSNDLNDTKNGDKSPVKKLQASSVSAGHGDIDNMEKNTVSDNKTGRQTGEHPYAMNVKWIYSADNPSPKQEEDFTDISKEMARLKNDSRKPQTLSCTDGIENTIDTIDNSRTAADSRVTSNYGCERIGQSEFENGNELSCAANFPMRMDSSFRCNDGLMSNNRRGSELSDVQTSHVSNGNPHIADYKQNVKYDLHRDIMMSSIRSKDGVHTTTDTTEMAHVTDKGFVFPSRANVTEPILLSPRVVNTFTRPSVSETCFSPRTSIVSVPLPQTASVLARQMMPSPKSKEPQTYCRENVTLAYNRDNSDIKSPHPRDVKSQFSGSSNENIQKRATHRSFSDVDHSPSKQIELMKIASLYRSISDPTSISPSKKNSLREERLRVESFKGYDEVFDQDDHWPPLPSQYSDEDSQYTRVEDYTKYISSDRSQPGSDTQRFCSSESLQYIPDNVKRQLFAESNRITYGSSKQRSIAGERRSRDSSRERIPDDMASFLIANQFCTAEDIRSFNERGNQPGEVENQYRSQERGDAQGYIQTIDRLGSRDRHLAGSVQYHQTHEDYRSKLQVPQQPVYYQTPSPPRRRNRGEIDIRMTCEDFRVSEKMKQLQETLRQVSHPGKTCTCANVENEILCMARDAYRKIRRKDDTKEAFEQFEEEVQETNSQIYEAMNILCGIKCFCKYGRVITDMFSGSIVFRVKCPTPFALNDLWVSYQSGELTNIVNKQFVWEGLRRKYSDIGIKLVVEISDEDYRRCMRELDTTISPGKLDNSLSKSDTEIASITGDSIKENVGSPKYSSSASRLTSIHIRSQSAPITQSPSPASSPSWIPKSPMSPLCGDRKFTFENPPRRILQERSKGSCSPTMKKLFDFDLSLSPKTSPKRKTFAEGLPWEHENIHPEIQSPKRKNVGTSFPFKDKSNDV